MWEHVDVAYKYNTFVLLGASLNNIHIYRETQFGLEKNGMVVVIDMVDLIYYWEKRIIH